MYSTFGRNGRSGGRIRLVFEGSLVPALPDLTTGQSRFPLNFAQLDIRLRKGVFFLQMANGLGRSLALAAARYGRVSGQRLLLVPLLFGLLPRLARLDALVEGLALVVGYGSQILDLFHFNLLLVCHFHGFFLADLALVLGLLCEILRRVLSELAVCKLWFIVLVHPSHLVARLLLSLVLMLHELVIVVLLEAVV